MVKFGKFIKFFRDECDLTQKEWADMFNVSETYVGRVERGQVSKDEVLDEYLQKIQFKYDSEVLGAFICGIKDYNLQKKYLMKFASTHGIKQENLCFQYV